MTLYRLPVPDDEQVSPILDRALRSPHCRLLRDTDYLNGEECVVFVLTNAPTVRKTWIAMESGLCLLKEEVRYTDSNGLIQRLVVDETSQVRPGVRLPTRFRLERFDGGMDENRPQRELAVHILRYLFNDDVPDSIFVPTQAPGSAKEVGGEDIQVVPGGEDLLLERVQWIKKYTLPSEGVSSPHSFAWAVAGLTCGLGLGLLVVAYKRTSGVP